MYVRVLIVLIIVLCAVSLYKLHPQKQTNLKSPQSPAQEVKGERTQEASAQSQIAGQAQRSIYLGMWTQGLFDPSLNTLNTDALKSLEAELGKKVAIAHYYLGWQWLSSGSLTSQLKELSENGWRPMLSVNPYFFGDCPANGLPLYRAIANGNCDRFLKASAQNLKTFSKPLFLRFAWEMNIPSMEWEIQKTGSTNADFIAAWRKIHDIFYQQGATNVLFIFSPDSTQTQYAQIYPGEKYVDWIALDGYNWGTTQNWSSWQSFAQVFQNAYNQITKVAPEKPLMIAETNSTNVGGDKAAWYQDALENQITNNFTKIKAVVFYNEDRTQKEGVNWKIDTSPDSLDAFKKAIQTPQYLSSY